MANQIPNKNHADQHGNTNVMLMQQEQQQPTRQYGKWL
jgi:hypothetical protein